MLIMFLCMYGLFILQWKTFKNMQYKKGPILDAQTSQWKTKTIQIEAKIRSTTQQHSSIIHVTANFALVRGSKPIP